MREVTVPVAKQWGIILKAVFFLYLAVLIWLLFISVGSTDREAYFDKRIIHWLPFKNTWRTLSIIFSGNYGAESESGFKYLAFRNIFGNILLFLPFGFLAPFVSPRLKNLKWAIAAAGFVSFTAESLQFIFSLGVFDIDDVIFNLAGGVIGFWISNKMRYLFLDKGGTFS